MAKKRRIKNPVARVLNEFNKPATHKDKTKYNRKKVPKDLFHWLSKMIDFRTTITYNVYNS